MHMSFSDGHLIRKAFLTKYGYAQDLTYAEILREFRNRYDQAQLLRQQNAGSDRIMLLIEGMADGSAREEALRERAARKRQVELLTLESGYGATELDQFVEIFAERLEVERIHTI